jgi:hypothetical protein
MPVVTALETSMISGVDDATLADAKRAAQEELARLESAERYAPPPELARQGYMPPMMPQRGYQEPEPAEYSTHGLAPYDPTEEVGDALKKPKVLEDLYALYPNIGNGTFTLQVHRILPKNWLGKSVAGFVAELNEHISMTDFARRFGGQKYVVWVHGPSARKDVNGQAIVRGLASVEVNIPGPPAMNMSPSGISEEDEEMGMTQQGFGGQVRRLPGGGGVAVFEQPKPDPQVELKRMDMEQKRWESGEERQARLEHERMQSMRDATRAPERAIDVIREQGQKSIDEIRSITNAQMEMLRADVDRAQKKAELLDAELRDVRVRHAEELSRVQREAKGEDAEAIRARADMHQRELTRITDDHRMTLERLNESHRRDATETATRHADEMRRMESNGLSERERLREDMSRREKQLQDDYLRERNLSRDTYEGRIQDLQRNFDREVAALRDGREREIAAMRLQYESQNALAKETASMRISTNDSELGRLRADNESLRRELEELRSRVHKDPLQAISEAKQLVDMITPDKDDDKGGEDEDLDWKKIAASGVKTLFEKGPEIMQELGKMRAGGAPPGFAGAPPPGMHPGMMNGQPPPRQMMQGNPQGPPQRQRRQQPGGPWAQGAPGFAPHQQPQWQQAPQAPPQVAPAAEPSWQQGPPPIPPKVGPEQGMQPAAPPPIPQALASQQPPVMQQVVYPPGGAQPIPQPMAQQPQAPRPIPQEYVEEFVKELNDAIQGHIVNPNMFAQGFIQRIGPDMAAHLVTTVAPEQFFEAIGTTPGGKGSAILTRDGQKYTRALWLEVHGVLSAMAAQAQEGGQPS